MNTEKSKTYRPQVKDLMTEDVFCLFEDDYCSFLEDAMGWKNIRHIPVVNHQKEIVGLVTHRDFLRIAISELAEIETSEKNKLYRDIRVSDIMQKAVAGVSPDTSLDEASKIMTQNKYGCLPVLKGKKIVGIITEADFVKAFSDWDVSFAR